MYEKYRAAAFGRCPHVFCQGQPVLPVGLSDLPRNYTVNVFCPRCHGLFFPKSTRQANIDGAYFGTTFPHLYLMTHPVSFCRILNFLEDMKASPTADGFFSRAMLTLYTLFSPFFFLLVGHGPSQANANVRSTGIRLQG